MKFSELLFKILIVIGITVPYIFSMDRRSIRIVIEQARKEEAQNERCRQEKTLSEQAARKRMFQIQLTRTVQEKWMRTLEEHRQQAQQLMDESKKEKYNLFPEIKESLWEKGQCMHRILTMTEPLEQEWLINFYAEDYYVWQAKIGKHNYDQQTKNL